MSKNLVELMANCQDRWFTTELVPRPVCGNSDEADVYDCICTEQIMQTCKYKSIARTEGDV